ncbi:hypothetical protein M3Y94_00661900 [Aphelenchoides besseyi]|nr:hypothetical protein M3Y94_00661900 [Aphelenchoides besseyi]
MDLLPFNHPFVAIWRVDYFHLKYKVLIDGDVWSSGLFAMEHPDFGSLNFKLSFMLYNNEQRMSVIIDEEAKNFSFTANYEAWLEIRSGKRSDVKKSQFTFSDHIRQQFFPVFSTKEVQRLVTSTPIFFCCRLPFPVKIVGIVFAETLTYNWTIDRFRWRFDCCGLQKFWRSNAFDGFDGTKFALVFYPKETKENCGLYLKIVEKANHLVVHSHFELYIKTQNDGRLHNLAAYHCFYNEDSRGWPNYTSQKKLLELAVDDTIVICCNLHLVIDQQPEVNSSLYLREFAASFNTDHLSDIQLYVNHKFYKVSSAIICTKSTVFNAMFTLSTKEKTTRFARIVGVETELFETLLIFLYTGEVENLKEVAGDLLFLADCYDVELLVEKMCQFTLRESYNRQRDFGLDVYLFFGAP